MKSFGRLSQVAQVPSTDSPSPLINRDAEELNYLGVGILVIILILAVGAISRQMKGAILFAALASAALIVTVFVL